MDALLQAEAVSGINGVVSLIPRTGKTRVSPSREKKVLTQKTRVRQE